MSVALTAFVDWMRAYVFRDRNKRLPPGTSIQYHPRSDEHSKKLGELIIQDLVAECSALSEHASHAQVAFAINHKFLWPNGKGKTLDLAVGIPDHPLPVLTEGKIHRLPAKTQFARLLIACEEKAVMTEHGKSQPRVYSELNDSHTIVHSGDRATIAAGITMVNIAANFIAPLRQAPNLPLTASIHNQPHIAGRMVEHLRKLPLRYSEDDVGFDAYCTFIVDVTNQGRVELWTNAPSPQPGDIDHYDSFLKCISEIYTVRFSDLSALTEQAPNPFSFEEAFLKLEDDFPGLLSRAADLLADNEMNGAFSLAALLRGFASARKRNN